MTTTVVNIHQHKGLHRPSPYDVYIGRPSKWGNKFKIGVDGTRDEVVAKYRAWIAGQPDLLIQIHELVGKRLGCYCAPLACHGDVLAELANRVRTVYEEAAEITPEAWASLKPGGAA